jgi:hypothetical protein
MAETIPMPNKKRDGGVTDGNGTPSNTAGVRAKDCPIDVLNHFVVLKLVPKREGLIAIPDTAQISENSAIVVGCGGDVINKEYLLGKHVIFAKFRYYEPFQFVDDKGKAENFLILNDTDIVGLFVDQAQSAQYKMQTQIKRSPIATPIVKG